MNTVNITFEIVNEELFSEKIIDVDTTGLTGIGFDDYGRYKGFRGTLSIETEEEGIIDSTGEFSQEDYVESYGFKLISQ